MTCPHCKCPECARVERPRSPLSNLPGWDIAERIFIKQQYDEAVRTAFYLQPKYTLPRSKSDWRDTVGEGR